MKTTYNIGLGNNPVDMETFLGNLSKMFILRHKYSDDGSWDGESERTCILVMVTDDQFDPFNLAKLMCTLMNQECIAVKVDGGESRLVYNTSFTGDKMEFDDQYFLEF
jgi:hypothetical protein